MRSESSRGRRSFGSRVLSFGSIGLLGFGLGLSAFTFHYARGTSYLTDDPRACANCHVMEEQLKGWERSSHRSAAVCNDCHTPHETAAKYWVKARNGWNHSVAFTLGRFPEPIRVTERNRVVVEAACRNCHGAVVEAIDGHPGAGQELACTSCHRDAGHRH